MTDLARLEAKRARRVAREQELAERSDPLQFLKRFAEQQSNFMKFLRDQEAHQLIVDSTDASNDQTSQTEGTPQLKMSRSDAFLDFAEKQASAVVKTQRRAAEKRAATAAEKKLAEREQTHRLWKSYHAKQIEELLKGPYAKAAHELIVFLGTMTPADEAALITLVKRGPWHAADSDTRFEILSLIDAALTSQRERAGLPPIDDALPGEESTAFLIVRGLLK
jgi:hypothetical protein